MMTPVAVAVAIKVGLAVAVRESYIEAYFNIFLPQ